jgi:hypothetical protein
MSAPAVSTNAAAVAQRMRAAQLAVRSELAGERQVLSQRIAADMKRRAPKGVRTTLANSVRVQDNGQDEAIIRPTVSYAPWVEGGRRPGKGLPWWGTLQAQGAMDWVRGLLDRAARATNPKYRRGAPGSARHSVEELELRTQYFFLSAAIKRRGIKPTHFIRETANAVRPQVNAALVAALRRAAAQLKGASGPSGGST